MVLTREKNASVVVHPTLGTCNWDCAFSQELRKRCLDLSLFLSVLCLSTMVDMCPDKRYTLTEVVSLSREVAVEPNCVFFCLDAVQKMCVL